MAFFLIGCRSFKPKLRPPYVSFTYVIKEIQAKTLIETSYISFTYVIKKIQKPLRKFHDRTSSIHGSVDDVQTFLYHVHP